MSERLDNNNVFLSAIDDDYVTNNRRRKNKRLKGRKGKDKFHSGSWKNYRPFLHGRGMDHFIETKMQGYFQQEMDEIKPWKYPKRSTYASQTTRLSDSELQKRIIPLSHYNRDKIELEPIPTPFVPPLKLTPILFPIYNPGGKQFVQRVAGYREIYLKRMHKEFLKDKEREDIYTILYPKAKLSEISLSEKDVMLKIQQAIDNLAPGGGLPKDKKARRSGKAKSSEELNRHEASVDSARQNEINNSSQQIPSTSTRTTGGNVEDNVEPSLDVLFLREPGEDSPGTEEYSDQEEFMDEDRIVPLKRKMNFLYIPEPNDEDQLPVNQEDLSSTATTNREGLVKSSLSQTMKRFAATVQEKLQRWIHKGNSHRMEVLDDENNNFEISIALEKTVGDLPAKSSSSKTKDSWRNAVYDHTIIGIPEAHTEGFFGHTVVPVYAATTSVGGHHHNPAGPQHQHPEHHENHHQAQAAGQGGHTDSHAGHRPSASAHTKATPNSHSAGSHAPHQSQHTHATATASHGPAIASKISQPPPHSTHGKSNATQQDQSQNPASTTTKHADASSSKAPTSNSKAHAPSSHGNAPHSPSKNTTPSHNHKNHDKKLSPASNVEGAESPLMSPTSKSSKKGKSKGAKAKSDKSDKLVITNFESYFKYVYGVPLHELEDIDGEWMFLSQTESEEEKVIESFDKVPPPNMVEEISYESQRLVKELRLYHWLCLCSGRRFWFVEPNFIKGHMEFGTSRAKQIPFFISALLLWSALVVMCHSYASISLESPTANETANPSPETRALLVEQLELNKYGQFFYFILANLAFVAIWSVLVILRDGQLIVHYLNCWCPALAEIETSAVVGIRNICIYNLLIWILASSILILAFLLFESAKGTAGLVGILMWRIVTVDIRLSTSTYLYSGSQIFGLVVSIYIMFCARVLFALMQSIALIVKNASEIWNFKFALTFNQLMITNHGHARRLTLKLPLINFFTHHRILTALVKIYSDTFGIPIIIYLSTQMALVTYILVKFFNYKEGSTQDFNDHDAAIFETRLDGDGKPNPGLQLTNITIPYYHPPAEELSISVFILVHVMVDYMFTTETLAAATQSFVDGFEFVRRTNLILCKTSHQRRLVQSLLWSMSETDATTISAANYFSVARTTIVAGLNTAIAFFSLIIQLQQERKIFFVEFQKCSEIQKQDSPEARCVPDEDIRNLH